MYRNIAFIGGIHGVGKSTVCKTICDVTRFEHLIASEVLKWKELENSAEKNVADVQQTQNRLLLGLNGLVSPNKKYLLDGHYCLLTKTRIIEKVPIDTFESIAPFLLIVVTDDVSSIKDRLEKRDSRVYDWNLLNEMQNCELCYAKQIAHTLKIELNICAVTNLTEIIGTFRKHSP
jgi:adenylate kinase